MATGTRIAINLNNCAGPLTVTDGVLTELEKSIGSTPVTVLGQYSKTFSDDTVTWVAILQESHVAVSIYLEDRHVTVDVHMCNEVRDNFELSKTVGNAISEVFKPASTDWREEKWASS